MKIAEARDEIYRLKMENVTLKGVIETQRIRISSMEVHIRDLETVYQLAHQRAEKNQ